MEEDQVRLNSTMVLRLDLSLWSFCLACNGALLHTVWSLRWLQGLQPSNRRHPAETGSVHEDVRWIREELRPGHGPGQHLDAAVLTVQERCPEHTGRSPFCHVCMAANAAFSINLSPFWCVRTTRNRKCVGTWRSSTTCWSPSRGFLATSCCSETTWRSCPRMLSTEKMQKVRLHRNLTLLISMLPVEGVAKKRVTCKINRLDICCKWKNQKWQLSWSSLIEMMRLE